MRKFYFITTTVITIFLAFAGVMMISGMNAIAENNYNIEQSYKNEVNAALSENKADIVNDSAEEAIIQHDLLGGKEFIGASILKYTMKNILTIFSYFQKQMKTLANVDMNIKTNMLIAREGALQ